MKVLDPSLKTSVFELDVHTTSAPEFVDLTDRVVDCLQQSQVRNGFVVVFSRHTTVAVTIQENEPLLLVDMANMLEHLSPQNGYYRHNDFDVRTVHMHKDECPNGHSHCQHLTLGTSETIPIVDGRLPLGEFQRIFAVELDGQKALQIDHREVLVQILGV